MADTRETSPTRRDFISGRAVRAKIEEAGDRAADALAAAVPEAVAPSAGPTVRVETRAMACLFAVVLNPGDPRHVMVGSEALDMIHVLDAQMTVYRPDSELSRLNAR